MTAALQIKFEKLLQGERVICSDADLDVLEQEGEIRSVRNPRQIGTLDRWVCWLDR